MNSPVLVCLVGSTAVGKTAVSLALAEYFKKFHPFIISADSRQVFSEIPIGTAQLPVKDRCGVPHFFMGTQSIFEDAAFNAGIFEQNALAILQQNPSSLGFVVGGSGLYVNALCFGLDEFPAISPTYREKAITLYQTEGLLGLQQALCVADPLYFSKVDQQNPQRLMRALEVFWATGQPFSAFMQKKTPKKRPFDVLFIGLHLPKDELVRNITVRSDAMLNGGLLEECEPLLPYHHYPALQTVGYPESFLYLQGKINRATLREQLIIHTCQYAKRQRTWFKKNPNIHWFLPSELDKIQTLCAQFMAERS